MAIRDNLSEWATVPFESQAHMIEAMRDRQYSDPRNAAYRQAVEAKLLISPNTGTRATVYQSTERADSGTDAGIGNGGNLAEAERRERDHNAERELYETRGAMSVSPAARARIERENRAPNSGDGLQEDKG